VSSSNPFVFLFPNFQPLTQGAIYYCLISKRQGTKRFWLFSPVFQVNLVFSTYLMKLLLFFQKHIISHYLTLCTLNITFTYLLTISLNHVNLCRHPMIVTDKGPESYHLQWYLSPNIIDRLSIIYLAWCDWFFKWQALVTVHFVFEVIGVQYFDFSTCLHFFNDILQ